MGERKVLNKYIPPDFDPALVPRGEKLSKKDGTVDVRMMLPFTLQCNFCHEFLYRGRKFNSKKERMGGVNGSYLGITRWRFYIKCTQCSRPITFLTDPKNADYEMENGGTRNYEIQKDKQISEEEATEKKSMDEKINPMKALETRVVESQKEMADMDNLEEIRAMNARHIKLDVDGILAPQKTQNDELSAEDEALVRSIQFGKKNKRLSREDELKLDEERKSRICNSGAMLPQQPKAKFVVKRRRVGGEETATTPAANVSSLLSGYGSSDDDSAE